MDQVIRAIIFACIIFLGMSVMFEIGRRIGRRRIEADGDVDRAGLGVVDGALFGLVGLLIAFTFSGAATRFDVRRQLTVDETNAIGTAWLRLDLLTTDARKEARELLKQYLDARIETYKDVTDPIATQGAIRKAQELQGRIWEVATTDGRNQSTPVSLMLLVPALNQVFDLAATQQLVTRQHPPMIIFIMLGIVSLFSALSAGYGMACTKRRSLVHMVGYPLIMAVAIYIILDLEYPRLGFITVSDFDQAFIELRQSMN